MPKKTFIDIDALLAHMEETHNDTNSQSSSHFEHDNEDAANNQTNETKPVKKWQPKHSNVLIV